VDNRSGHGIPLADGVLAYSGATPQPLVRTGQPTVTPTTGDGDAFLEPGETATLALPVTNVGDGTATGISVTVDASDPEVTITPRARSYGDLASQATTSRNFTLSLASGYPLGKPVALAVRVTFAGVLSPTRATLHIPTGEPATAATTFAYSGPAVPIPDASALGASVRISVSGVGYASKLTFSIDGTTCTTDEGATTVGIDHTFVSDLVGTLTAPGGHMAVLLRRADGDGNNLCRVVFDDAASEPFANVTGDDAPFTGTWRPDQPLSDFLTDPVDGMWTFKVVDELGLDTGNIRAVSLHIAGFVRD
jgi:subtilisin-like proprotein convertase family protein